MLDIRQTSGYYLHLLRSAVQGRQPQPCPEGLDLRDIQALAIAQGTDLLVLQAVQQLETAPPADLMAAWTRRRAIGIGREAAQEAECEAITRMARDLGFRVLPLKGLFIKRLYPQPWLRQMSDIDLLCTGTRTEALRAGMRGLGFLADPPSRGSHHEAYVKRPFVRAELHDQLFAPGSPLIFRARAEDYFAPVSPGEPEAMRLEDRYLHLLLHALTHLTAMGVGLRPVLDLHLFLRRYGDHLDRGQIDPILEARQALVFARRMEALAAYLFDSAEPEADPQLDALAAYLASGGVHGSLRGRLALDLMRHADRRGGRPAALLREVFPSADYLSKAYPVLDRAPVLLPVVWLLRVGTVLLRRPMNASKKMKAFSVTTGEEVRQLRQVCDLLGLEPPRP